MCSNEYASDIVGEIDFRAPEVEEGKYSFIADFWSLCTTFHFAFTGK